MLEDPQVENLQVAVTLRTRPAQVVQSSLVEHLSPVRLDSLDLHLTEVVQDDVGGDGEVEILQVGAGGLHGPGELLHAVDQAVRVDGPPAQHQAGQQETFLPTKLLAEAVDDTGVGLDHHGLQVDLDLTDVLTEEERENIF